MVEGWRYIVAAACALSCCASLASSAAHAFEIEPATTIIPKLQGPTVSMPLAAPTPTDAEPPAEFRPSLAVDPTSEAWPATASNHAAPLSHAAPSSGGADTPAAWTATLTRTDPMPVKPAAPSLPASANLIVPLPTKGGPALAQAVSTPASPPAQDGSAAQGNAPLLASASPNQPVASAPGPITAATVMPPRAFLHREVGLASFYRADGQTASGMKVGGMTAAHRKLPFGSRVTVKDMATGKQVVVTITDRGPFLKSRVIDLSHMAARELGITGRGVARVEVVSAN